MTNAEKYKEIFLRTFDISEEETKNLKYQDIPAWDSVGHMALIAELEDGFGIMMETDDIIDFSSFTKGTEIMKKYGIEI